MGQNNMPNVGVTPDVKARMKVFLFYVARYRLGQLAIVLAAQAVACQTQHRPRPAHGLFGGNVQLAAQGVEQIGLRLGRLYLALLLLVLHGGYGVGGVAEVEGEHRACGQGHQGCQGECFHREGPRWPGWPGKRGIRLRLRRFVPGRLSACLHSV